MISRYEVARDKRPLGTGFVYDAESTRRYDIQVITTVYYNWKRDKKTKELKCVDSIKIRYQCSYAAGTSHKVRSDYLVDLDKAYTWIADAENYAG